MKMQIYGGLVMETLIFLSCVFTGSMEYMPETLKVFRDAGVEFRHGYVSTPICCPSRSSLLTGL